MWEWERILIDVSLIVESRIQLVSVSMHVMKLQYGSQAAYHDPFLNGYHQYIIDLQRKYFYVRIGSSTAV
jgi:hypothetical protein